MYTLPVFFYLANDQADRQSPWTSYFQILAWVISNMSLPVAVVTWTNQASHLVSPCKIHNTVHTRQTKPYSKSTRHDTTCLHRGDHTTTISDWTPETKTSSQNTPAYHLTYRETHFITAGGVMQKGLLSVRTCNVAVVSGFRHRVARL